MRPASRHMLLAVVVAAAGCDGDPRPRQPNIPLESAAQMTAYLSREARVWAANDASAHRWLFRVDGRFELWLDGAPGADLEDELGEPAFDGARRIEGEWEASMTTLTLRGFAGADELTYPLGWVDGRRRIEIAGLRYRSPPPDEERRETPAL